MASLYELDQAVLTVLESGLIFDEETGEIIWDEENFAQLEMERTAKLESVALFIKNLEADIAAMKAEEQTLAKRRSVKEKKAQWYRHYLSESMRSFGDTKLDTPRCVLSFRKSEFVEITDESKIRADLWKKADPKPDTAAIKKALKSGEAIEGAVLKERQNLQIK